MVKKNHSMAFRSRIALNAQTFWQKSNTRRVWINWFVFNQHDNDWVSQGTNDSDIPMQTQKKRNPSNDWRAINMRTCDMSSSRARKRGVVSKPHCTTINIMFLRSIWFAHQWLSVTPIGDSVLSKLIGNRCLWLPQASTDSTVMQSSSWVKKMSLWLLMDRTFHLWCSTNKSRTWICNKICEHVIKFVIQRKADVVQTV